MQYLLLVIEHEERTSMPAEERHHAYERMMQFSERLKARGVWRTTAPWTKTMRAACRRARRRSIAW
jgi:hypothetical protein